MLQAAAAAVLLLASEAWHSHGVLELLAAGAWWRHPAPAKPVSLERPRET